jgi:hypothetical protein
MKNSFYTFLIISLLFSCKSNTKQKSQDTLKSQSVNNQTEALIKKDLSIMQGVWVKQDYIDKITKTRSVLSAMDEAFDIITIYIDKSNIKGDSLVAPTGNSHEGSEIILHLQKGSTPESIKDFGGGEVRYSFEHGDTILLFTRIDDSNKKSITTKYIKALNTIPKPDGYLGSGIDYLINKALVSGNYIMTDTTGSSTKVSFTNDGKVSGFLNYSKYGINFDLISDVMDNLDEISLDGHTKNHASFSYKIIGDTLSLYNTYPSTDSTELILGKRIYKLVKQR